MAHLARPNLKLNILLNIDEYKEMLITVNEQERNGETVPLVCILKMPVT